MTARAGDGVVLIEGQAALQATKFAVATAILAKNRNGAGPGEHLRALYVAIEKALSANRSDSGHTDIPELEHLASSTQELIGSTEAARILGCSPRHVTRIRTDLNGQWTGRSWIFHRDTVTEYAERRRDDRAA